MHEMDIAMLNSHDYEMIHRHIEEQARITATNQMDYQFLINDNSFCQSIAQSYITFKKSSMSRKGEASLGLNESLEVGIPCTQVSPEGTSGANDDSEEHRNSRDEDESVLRDRIASRYGVIMTQFQTSFKDTTYDSLKTDCREDRMKTYTPKVGCLGMKTFDFGTVSQSAMLEAVTLYILDEIEEKQRKTRSASGLNFLDRIGMDTDVSSYYHGHRKSHHGGSSSVLYAFNDLESYSFRRSFMKHGLKSDMTAMDEADSRSTKNPPYQRSCYGQPQSKSVDQNVSIAGSQN
jgi:hypothetical protein